MFNFIASSLMVYLLVNVFIQPGQMSPESRAFEAHTWMPAMHQMLGWFGIAAARSPLNLSFVWALVCRSEEHTSELQPLMRISYAVFCLKKKTQRKAYIH